MLQQQLFREAYEHRHILEEVDQPMFAATTNPLLQSTYLNRFVTSWAFQLETTILQSFTDLQGNSQVQNMTSCTG